MTGRYSVMIAWGDILAETRDLRSAAAVYVDALARGMRAVGVYDEESGEAVDEEAIYDALAAHAPTEPAPARGTH